MASNILPSDLSFSSNGGSYPPHGFITAQDHGPYVVVADWIFMCVMVLFVATRLDTWARTLHRVDADDRLIVAAAALLITQSITVHLAVNNGLGRHEASLSMSSLSACQKVSLLRANGIFNIVSDVIIMVFPAWIVWQLQMRSKYKLAVILIFWAKISVVVSAAIQLVALPSYVDTTDETWTKVTPTIWAQVVMALSIITANAPLLKPFLNKVQSGLIDSSLPKVAGNYKLSNFAHGAKYSKQKLIRSRAKSFEGVTSPLSHSANPLATISGPPSAWLASRDTDDGSADREYSIMGNSKGAVGFTTEATFVEHARS